MRTKHRFWLLITVLAGSVAGAALTGCGLSSPDGDDAARTDNRPQPNEPPASTEVADVVNAGGGAPAAKPDVSHDVAAAGIAQAPSPDIDHPSADTAADFSPRARRFRFDYGGTVTELTPGEVVRVWLPVPLSSADQEVKTIDIDVPGDHTISSDVKYGNQILYFEAKAPQSGALSFNVTYEVNRKEVTAASGSQEPTLDEARRALFLAANAKVPVDGKPLELLSHVDLPAEDWLAVGRFLYDRVDEHMKYDKSRPGYGTGDAAWACDSRFGNCTDFHSLFIALARSQKMPARFEIGFPLPPDQDKGTIGGYHCWAYFFIDDKGWLPVDISEADKYPDMKDYYFGNLTAHCVTFSVGRDIELVPRQAGPSLNYFVYPYVEVNGQPWPRAKIEKRFEFQDL